MSDNWSTLKRLFAELSELSPDEQQQRLTALNGQDPALARELEALLSAENTNPATLHRAVHSATNEFMRDPLDLFIGSRMGAFRITSHLASGGMGEIFRGERADGAFEQTVAIKLIRSGALSADDLRRFTAERQILARLEHPGIARILDGGTADDGTAYLVMEFIEGVPIDRYCNENELDLRARIRLFRKVLNAVDFAHRNLIVHRDLKPSNILVDQNGEPRLLDFGIAKLLADETDRDDSDVTRIEERALTPDFASPEQMLGEPITTASDVYSLGVLLYLLVTGAQPYTTRGLRASECEKVICETEPPTPSSTASTNTRKGLYSDTPTPAPSRLRGDIDAIVMTAMRKDVAHRYASVGAFADELDRYLDGVPVEARGRHLPYLVQKFVRRHALPVAASLLLVTSAVGATAYHTETLTEERDLVQAEAEKSDAVISFMTDMFELQLTENEGALVTAKEVLDRGAARLDEELGAQPLTRAALGTTIANVYDNLGLYDEAIRHHRDALSIHEAYGNTEGMLQNLRGLGNAYAGQRDFENALPMFERLLSTSSAAMPGDSRQRASWLSDYGLAFYHAGDFNEAQAKYDDALAMLERIGETDNDTFHSAQNNLAQVLHILGDLETALPLFKASVAAAREQYGDVSSETAKRLHNFAVLQTDRGELDAAESMLLEAYEIEKVTLGPDHPLRDILMANLSRLYRKMGDLEKAADWAEASVEHSTRTRGPTHPDTAYNINGLAKVLFAKADYEAADVRFREALAAYDAAENPDYPYIASTALGVANTLLELDRAGEAVPFASRALELSESTLPEGHWLITNCMTMLADALMRTGRDDEAAPILQTAFTTVAANNPGHPLHSKAAELMGEYHEGQGQPAEAERYRQLAHSLRTDN